MIELNQIVANHLDNVCLFGFDLLHHRDHVVVLVEHDRLLLCTLGARRGEPITATLDVQDEQASFDQR